MTKELNGEEVHLGGELGVFILAAVELRGCRERVDKDEGGLRWIVGVGHLVASCGPEVGDLDGLGVRHDECCRGADIAISCSKGQHVMSMGDEDEDLNCENNGAVI